MILVPVKRLPHAEGLPLPAYATDGAAGLDLCAAIAPGTVLSIPPHAWRLVPTGFALAIPTGFEGQVRPRSGLAQKHGVTVLNAPGTVDPDYRGEVGVILVNHGATPFEIHRGDRIAQLVIAPVARAELHAVADLNATARGTGGFGSTGVSRHG